MKETEMGFNYDETDMMKTVNRGNLQRGAQGDWFALVAD